ncbi:hypothetical protein SNEBB_000392, partial [Seison nebaliae]
MAESHRDVDETLRQVVDDRVQIPNDDQEAHAEMKALISQCQDEYFSQNEQESDNTGTSPIDEEDRARKLAARLQFYELNLSKTDMKLFEKASATQSETWKAVAPIQKAAKDDSALEDDMARRQKDHVGSAGLKEQPRYGVKDPVIVRMSKETEKSQKNLTFLLDDNERNDNARVRYEEPSLSSESTLQTIEDGYAPPPMVRLHQQLSNDVNRTKEEAREKLNDLRKEVVSQKENDQEKISKRNDNTDIDDAPVAAPSKYLDVKEETPISTTSDQSRKIPRWIGFVDNNLNELVTWADPTNIPTHLDPTRDFFQEVLTNSQHFDQCFQDLRAISCDNLPNLNINVHIHFQNVVTGDKMIFDTSIQQNIRPELLSTMKFLYFQYPHYGLNGHSINQLFWHLYMSDVKMSVEFLYYSFPHLLARYQPPWIDTRIRVLGMSLDRLSSFSYQEFVDMYISASNLTSFANAGYTFLSHIQSFTVGTNVGQAFHSTPAAVQSVEVKKESVAPVQSVEKTSSNNSIRIIESAPQLNKRNNEMPPKKLSLVSNQETRVKVGEKSLEKLKNDIRLLSAMTIDIPNVYKKQTTRQQYKKVVLNGY